MNLTGESIEDIVCVFDRCGCDFERTKLTELHATIVEENAEDDPELFLLQGDEIDLDEVLEHLQCVFGIAALCRACVCEKTMEDIAAKAEP